MVVTMLCGAGHVGSSVVLGCLGIVFGTVLTRLEFFEAARNNVAGWMLIGFGLAYTAWAIVRNCRNRPHTHSDGTIHCHEPAPARSGEGQADHLQVHRIDEIGPTQAESAAAVARAELTAWTLFTIFVFGPCEPLIPLLMYPAARSAWWGMALVAGLFAAVTIATMTIVVGVLVGGANLVGFPWLHRHTEVIAGIVLTACGVTVKFGLY